MPLADLIRSKKDFPGQSAGVNLWERVFGTEKESSAVKTPVRGNAPGGSYARSSVSGDASFKRLLQAMRSMAPGGWSDDRWSQTMNTFYGVPYVAIHRICTQLAQAEFQVYEKATDHPDGKKPVMQGHPGYKLVELLEKPNNQDSFGKLLYRWVQQKFLTGSALTWMVPNQLGTPMELYVIPTATAIPQPAMNPDYPDGFWRIQPVYPYGPFSSYPTPASAVGAAIPAQWMLRNSWPHPLLRYDGYSPSTGLNMEIDEFRQMGRSRWYSMKRSINPSAVLNFKEMETWAPLPVEEIDRIHAEWESNIQGTENHGNLIVGTPGSELEEWGRSPKDMDYPNGWEQLSSFLFGGYGTNKPAVGMADAASYANFWASLKQLYWVSLDPECNDIASELTRHLAPFFGDNLIIEIRCRPINDWDINAAKIEKGISGKCMTKNEVRQMLELSVTSEEWGTEIAGMDSKEMVERQKEAQAQEQPGMPGQPGQAPQGRPTPPDLSAVEKERPMPPDLGTQPSTGTLGEGALGPRTKRFVYPQKKKIIQGSKSLYDKVTKALTNGFHSSK